MVIKINNDYQELTPWLCKIPQLFQEEEGLLLYHGRNQIRLFEVDGNKLVVKAFKKHNWFKAVAYSFLRKNKALRSFENAKRLRQLHFSTPLEIAYIELRQFGLIRQVFYISNYTEAKAIRTRLLEQEPFDESLATSYAQFVAALHLKGILHQDLNSTNVLFKEKDGQFCFELIDINRMYFYNDTVPIKKSMENLSLFCPLTSIYYFILNEYALQRGWGKQMISKAITIKQKHDKWWIIKKKLTHPFSN